jgi:uncharacterized membrane protein YedE/YeeE
MPVLVFSFFIGFLFAVGLGISGMTETAKVTGFLDVFGNWDPSLLFVMIGAIGVHAVAYRLIRRRASPLLSPRFHVSAKRELTFRLIAGSMLFGVGWGIVGYCPGPAIVSLVSLKSPPWFFVAAMIVGMAAYRAVEKNRTVESYGGKLHNKSDGVISQNTNP